MDSTAAFLQGVFSFEGRGFERLAPLSGATYTVPGTRRAQAIYLRAGHTAETMVALVLLRDGSPMRYFPIPANGAVHVPLAVVEDLMPEARVEFQVLAPEGTAGTVVVDLGLMEIA